MQIHRFLSRWWTVQIGILGTIEASNFQKEKQNKFSSKSRSEHVME